MKNKKVFLALLIVSCLCLIIGSTYAFFNYSKTSTTNSELVTGEVYFNFNNESNGIVLTNAFPESATVARTRTDNTFTFDITGRNTYRMPIYYEIDLVSGEVPAGYVEANRILPEYLRFDLMEGETLVVDNGSYADLNNKRIWVNTIDEETSSNVTTNYTLRMWIDENLLISDTDANAVYTTGAYESLFASVKVRVIGDFDVKELPKVCKRATTLHTETCSQTSTTNYCGADGYANGATITYGNLGSGTLQTGDAFDCDVNGDGEYNSETERFYYVTDMNSDTVVLIYYNNVSGGLPDNMSSYAYNTDDSTYLGPQTAKLQLPTTSQWKNVSLTNTTRDMKDELGTTKLSGFSYEGYAARLLTTQEVSAGCGFTIGSYVKGEISTKCKFLMENTKYSSSSLKTYGSWLETPTSFLADRSWLIQGDCRYANIGIVNNTSTYGVRPAIEVLKSDISL